MKSSGVENDRSKQRENEKCGHSDFHFSFFLPSNITGFVDFSKCCPRCRKRYFQTSIKPGSLYVMGSSLPLLAIKPQHPPKQLFSQSLCLIHLLRLHMARGLYRLHLEHPARLFFPEFFLMGPRQRPLSPLAASNNQTNHYALYPVIAAHEIGRYHTGVQNSCIVYRCAHSTAVALACGTVPATLPKLWQLQQHHTQTANTWQQHVRCCEEHPSLPHLVTTLPGLVLTCKS